MKSLSINSQYLQLISTSVKIEPADNCQFIKPNFCLFHVCHHMTIERARLYLAQSEAGDSGNYTCVCDQNLKQTVRLVVTLGRSPTSSSLCK